MRGASLVIFMLVGCPAASSGSPVEAVMDEPTTQELVARPDAKALVDGPTVDADETPAGRVLIWVPIPDNDPCGPVLVGDSGQLRWSRKRGERGVLDEQVTVVKKGSGRVGVESDAALPPESRAFLALFPTGRPISKECSGKVMSVQ